MDLLYLYAEYGRAWTSRATKGMKKLYAFFICPSHFLNGRLCANDFTVKAFEYGNAVDTVEGL